MTTISPDVWETIVTDVGVYAPQHDSRLMIEVLRQSKVVAGRTVLDFCTGSGVLAVAAARMGASQVTALDICPRAVRCSRANGQSAGVEIDVWRGTLSDALASGPFDVVVSNPPYVPVAPDAPGELIPAMVGPARAWDAAADGRLVLDPLCAAAPELMTAGGTMFVVQSEFADVDQSLTAFKAAGLSAELVCSQWVPFGPVLSSRATWLQDMGWLRPGRREELLVVIRADKKR